MDPRSRSNETTAISGRIYKSNGETLGVGIEKVRSQAVDDFWHKKVRSDNTLPPSECVIRSTYRDPIQFSYPLSSVRASAYPVDNQGDITESDWTYVRPQKGSPQRLAENNQLALELLAATNPFRSEFSIPVAIAEMVELSSMFKLAASSFSSFVGGTYLNYKFGWEQFVRDLKTLANITKTLESRIKEIQSLPQHGGLRRNVFLDARSKTLSSTGVTVHSTWGFLVHANVTKKLSCKVRGSVRWRYKGGYDVGLSKLETFNLAVQKIFDLGTFDSETLWNMIPFSWLVDYFVDVNSWLVANLDSGTVEPYDLCIIRRCHASAKYYPIPRSNYSFSGVGTLASDRYERDVVESVSFPTPTIWMLTSNQLVTIAALLLSFKR